MEFLNDRYLRSVAVLLQVMLINSSEGPGTTEIASLRVTSLNNVKMFVFSIRLQEETL